MDSRSTNSVSTWKPQWPILIGLIGLLGVAVWWFNGVMANAQMWLLIALGILCVWPARKTAGPVSRATKWTRGLLAAGVLVGLLQVTPLPQPAMRVLAPQVTAWRAEFGGPIVGEFGQNAVIDAAGSREWSTISLDPYSTRNHLAILLLGTGVFWLTSSRLSDPHSAGVLIATMFAIGVAVALVGLFQQFTWNGKLLWFYPVTQSGDPFGPFANSNNAGGYLNMCIGCGVAIWFRRRRAKVNWGAADIFFAGGIVLMLAGVLATASRGSALGLFAGGIVLLVTIGRQRSQARVGAQYAWVLLLIGVTAAVGMVLDLQSGVQEEFGKLSAENGLRREGRLQCWSDALANAPALMPMGGGLNAFRYLYRRQPDYRTDGLEFTHAENQYVQTLVDAGIPGVGILLGLLACAWVSIVRCAAHQTTEADARQSHSEAETTRAVGLVAAFALGTQVVAAIFDFGLYLPGGAMGLACLVGLAHGRASRHIPRHAPEDSETAPDGPKTRWRFDTGVATSLALGALCLISAVDRWRGSVAESEQRQIQLQIANDSADSAPTDIELDGWMSGLRRAVAAAPDRAETHVSLAELYLRRFRASSAKALQESRPWLSPLDVANRTSFLQQFAAAQNLREEQGEEAVVTFVAAAGSREYLDAAEHHARRARSLLPRLASAHFVLANVAAVKGNGEEVSQHLARAEKLDPGNAGLAFSVGEFYLEGGSLEPAIAAFRRAVQLSRRLRAPVFELTRKAVEEAPSNAWLRAQLALLAAESGDFEVANAQMEVCQQQKPLDPQVLSVADRIETLRIEREKKSSETSRSE